MYFYLDFKNYLCYNLFFKQIIITINSLKLMHIFFCCVGFYRRIKMFLFKTIKDFNISLDHQINNQMQPRLDAYIQMRLIALFNKYWSGNLEIHRFTKLWIRLNGPLVIIQDFKFYRYFSKEDVDFIDYIIKLSSKPTFH